MIFQDRIAEDQAKPETPVDATPYDPDELRECPGCAEMFPDEKLQPLHDTGPNVCNACFWWSRIKNGG